MDKNEFFRNATSRICGNLEIEEALVSSLNFLREYMPVDRMLLQFFDEGLNSMHTIASATVEKGVMINLLTPLTSKARENMANFEQEYLSYSIDSAWLINDNPHDQPLFHEMLAAHKAKVTSLLVLPLKIHDKIISLAANYQ